MVEPFLSLKYVSLRHFDVISRFEGRAHCLHFAVSVRDVCVSANNFKQITYISAPNPQHDVGECLIFYCKT